MIPVQCLLAVTSCAELGLALGAALVPVPRATAGVLQLVLPEAQQDTLSSATGRSGAPGDVSSSSPCPCKAAVSGVSEGPCVCVGSLADTGQRRPPGPVVPQERLPDGFSSQIPSLWGGCLFQAAEQSKPRQSEECDYEILATPAASACCDPCF